MRICRFFRRDDPARAPRLGLLEGDTVRDVTPATDALPPLAWPLPPGDHLIANLAAVRARIEAIAGAAPTVPRSAVALLSPVANPAKFVCGAGNWKHMGAPFGMIGFMGKATTSLAGEAEGIEISWPDRVTVHEPELCIVIGRQGRNIPEAEALDHVAGYACAFDTTMKPEREDWAFCKAFDTFGTIGPCLVTADEIPDPGALAYEFRVNGELRGARTFANLSGSPARMIALASSAMTLYPGDLVLSGAADVAPIAIGDRLELTIPEIGTLACEVLRSPYARSAPWPLVPPGPEV